MGEIGRELEREQHVVQAQLFADVATDHSVVAQLQQTVALFGDLQLLGRAQHALAFDAAQLAQLDGKRLAVFTGRQQRTDGGTRHLDAGARVRCTADDVQRSTLPHIHLAHAQAIGVGVLFGAQYLPHDHAGKSGGERAKFFDLQTGHGQGVGQLLAGQGRVAEGAQPGFGKLHETTQYVGTAMASIGNTAEPALPGCWCCPLEGVTRSGAGVFMF